MNAFAEGEAPVPVNFRWRIESLGKPYGEERSGSFGFSGSDPHAETDTGQHFDEVRTSVTALARKVVFVLQTPRCAKYRAVFSRAEGGERDLCSRVHQSVLFSN
jgi:hypothetical protein